VTGAWWQGPLVAFDLETTGVDQETARIVTACVARINPGSAPQTSNWLVDPGIDIPEEASRVHGITTEHAQEHGIARPGVAAITAELRSAWTAGIPVVIMNASYDLTIMDRELRRHLQMELGDIGPVIDPMVIDRALDKWRKGKRTLIDLCQTYQVKLEDAHTAAGDCLAAARVAWRLAQAYPEVGEATLADLFTQQQAWRAEWATDFRDYLARQGKDASDVSGEWPLKAVA
jgi:DNA polymerase-3 subunit epsilon